MRALVAHLERYHFEDVELMTIGEGVGARMVMHYPHISYVDKLLGTVGIPQV